jgi:hypothetical protein
MKGMIRECSTLKELYATTDKLDKAAIVPLKIDDGGVIKDVDNYKGVYNISQGKFCTSVVPYYNLIQHKEYFDSFAVALNRLNIKFKSTIKVSGNRAFCDIEFLNKNVKFDKLNEEFTTGIRLVNSYDKTTGLHAAPRLTRLACTNGMILTRSEKTVSIKHHSKVAKDIQVFVERRINEFVSRYDDLRVYVSESMKDSIEWNKACRIIEHLFKQLKHREEILKRLGISVIINTNDKTKKKSVSYIWDDNTTKKKKINRWDLYNAITNYLTHGEQITPHIESLFHAKAEKLLITKLSKMPLVEVTLKA